MKKNAAPFISAEDCRKILSLTNSSNPAEELAMRARFIHLNRMIAAHRSSIRQSVKSLEMLKKKMAKV